MLAQPIFTRDISDSWGLETVAVLGNGSLGLLFWEQSLRVGEGLRDTWT